VLLEISPPVTQSRFVCSRQAGLRALRLRKARNKIRDSAAVRLPVFCWGKAQKHGRGPANRHWAAVTDLRSIYERAH